MFWFAFILLTVSLLFWFFVKNVKKQSQPHLSETAVEDNFVAYEEALSPAQLSVQELNEKLPLHSMWDGFWIYELYQDTLTITCSFDSIYYRDFDIVFKGVTFFNTPIKWRDTNMRGNDFLRIASKREFNMQQPGFDTKDLNIFVIDMYFNFEEAPDPHNFFVVAKSVKLVNCSEEGDTIPGTMYDDPYPSDMIYSKRNKMP